MITATLLAANLLLHPLASPDPWFAEDKLRHFFTSFLVTSFSASAVRLAGVEPRTSLWVGVGAGALAGLYKEVRDTSVSGFSGRDLLWDVSGISASATILELAR